MHVSSSLFLIFLSEYTRSQPINQYDDENPSPIQRKIDVYPEHFQQPVPFGHIPLEGFGDPYSPGKQPLDPLELDMIVPKNKEEEKELLKKGRTYVQFVKNTIPKGFASPRDMYLRDILSPPHDSNGTQLKWYNLAEMQIRNAMKPPMSRPISQKRGPTQEMAERRGRIQDPKKQYFSKNSFVLKEDKDQLIQKINWTSCDQFAVGAIFSPKDIVDYEWIPFYIWAIEGYQYSVVHKFTYPTKKLVSEYHMKYNKFLNKTIDWSHTKLHLQGMNEMLLIAADKRGLFDALPKHEIPDSARHTPIMLPSLSIRLKIEDPYLVMTFCEDYFATVMAISGSEPTNYKDMKAEAATINFVGTGRPVWRDYEGEKEKAQLIKEAEIRNEQEKIIKLEAPVVAINQYD